MSKILERPTFPRLNSPIKPKKPVGESTPVTWWYFFKLYMQQTSPEGIGEDHPDIAQTRGGVGMRRDSGSLAPGVVQRLQNQYNQR